MIFLLYTSAVKYSVIGDPNSADSFDGKSPEATVQRCSLEKVFLKYAENLQESTHAAV